MLVKHNLLNNPFSFKRVYSSDPLKTYIKNGVWTIRGKAKWATSFVEEDTNGDVLKWEEYFIGYVGTVFGPLSFFHVDGDSYKGVRFHKDLIYGTRILGSTKNPNIFYMSLGSENTELKIKKFFVTDELADIIIDKKSIQSEERQAIYPPEGNYKEIQAL